MNKRNLISFNVLVDASTARKKLLHYLQKDSRWKNIEQQKYDGVVLYLFFEFQGEKKVKIAVPLFEEENNLWESHTARALNAVTESIFKKHLPFEIQTELLEMFTEGQDEKRNG